MMLSAVSPVVGMIIVQSYDTLINNPKKKDIL